MNYLGIDYGEHRVGIAFADSELKWAFARETIDQKKTDLMKRLSELVKENKVDVFVVGMPFRPDGRPDGKNLVVEEFVRRLAERFPQMPIQTEDEAYTSVAALQETSYLKKKKKRQDKGLVDRLAAQHILQSYLDGL
ncbi:MAG: Holliday junction resolvase RuvX [Fibrobacter intestinalis]|uniref:Holliday junction resolvase RuvX n=1 Tax=Fibrobacter intestinalis TaxID=28122 RepID=UPI003F0D7307